MDPVAGLTRNGWLISKIRAQKMPRSGSILRLNQFSNRPIEMHAMAAQAIIIQAALCVVSRVGKDLAICRTVRTRVPRGVLALVAPLAVPGHFHHVRVAKMNSFRQVSEK